MTAVERLAQEYGRFMCLALVKPRSGIARQWQLSEPAYCIFEFDPGLGEAQIRWGDGRWQNLQDEKELDDLILLHQYGEEFIAELFG